MRASAKYIWIFILIAFVGGFLLMDTSGLLSTAPITTNTTVATVNGEDILASVWYQTAQNLEQQATQQSGQSVTLDERQRFQDQAFDELVNETLLRQEYKRRGITVTDEEILQAALYSPPPQMMQAPDLQTDGQFDPAKYERFLRSPLAKQEGLLYQLEQYYRAEIPKEKLFDQIASEVYVTEAQMWRRWQDSHDSAQISFVLFSPELIPDTEVRVTADEVRAYYDSHKEQFDRPGRAKVSVLIVPRVITAADSAAVRDRLLQMRSRILGGEKFEDVARAESADSVSAAQGGSLGRGPRGRFVAPFEEAAARLRPGEISQPVLTQFGYHLIRLDERKGDTLALRHILLRIQQRDSAAAATDRRADSLARIAASSEDGTKLDEAARTLRIPLVRAETIEGNPLTLNGRFIPSVGPWAFQGARPGETSELFDAEDGYYLARLDSIKPGGVLTLEQAEGEIRPFLMRGKKIDALLPRARNFAKIAAASSLERAAELTKQTIVKPKPFTRVSGAPELTNLPEVVGAAFALPLDSVSEPVRATSGVVVMRVDERQPASRAAFEAQKEALRQQELQQARQQRVREFLTNLRASADIEDNRREVEASARRASQ